MCSTAFSDGHMLFSWYILVSNILPNTVVWFRLVDDRACRYKTRMNTRKHLEDDWCRSVHMKRARDAEDHLANLCPEGLVQEQCNKYRRCRRCERRLSNTGTTNLWCETRYIPGSRLMV